MNTNTQESSKRNSRLALLIIAATIVAMLGLSSVLSSPLARQTGDKAALQASIAPDTLILLGGSADDPQTQMIEKQLRDFCAAGSAASPIAMVYLPMPPNEAAHSKHLQLAHHFDIDSFPAIILLDSAAKPYGCFSTSSSSIAPIDQILRLRESRNDRDAHFAAAQIRTGPEKAQRLLAGLKCVESFIISDYSDVAMQIIQLDPGNQTGFGDQYRLPLVKQRIDLEIQGTVFPLIDRGNFSAARNQIDQIIESIQPPLQLRQTLIAFKAQLFSSQGDYASAKILFDQALAMDPAGPSAPSIHQARNSTLANAP